MQKPYIEKQIRIDQNTSKYEPICTKYKTYMWWLYPNLNRHASNRKQNVKGYKMLSSNFVRIA